MKVTQSKLFSSRFQEFPVALVVGLGIIAMNEREFEDAPADAMIFFPGIEINHEQKAFLKSVAVKRKDVLGVLPNGYSKSLINQLLLCQKTCKVLLSAHLS